MLANHSRLHTFPETGVFLKALGMRGRELPWTRLGLTLGKERKALARLRDQSELTGSRLPPLPPRRFRLRQSIDEVVAFLDRMANAHGSEGWVEKTPRHVLHARRIQELIPESLCIHVVRDGRDVVGSIVDRARRFPERFPGQENPKYGIHQWNRSLEATRQVAGKPGHLVVMYEKLVEDPEATLVALCQALGLPYEAEMLARGETSSFVQAQEGWKSKVSGPIQASASKFPEVFDSPTQRWIEERLDMDSYTQLEEAAESGLILPGTA
jgi:hypothetical protein